MTTTAPVQVSVPTPTALPQTRRRRGWLAPALVLLLAVVAWLIAAPTMHDAAWNPFGLLAAASPLFAVSLIGGALAFCLSIAMSAHKTATVSLFAFVLMLRLPMATAVDVPLYSWTYKHFGVIDYIQRFGGVAPDVDIYHNWPGAFALIAWINSITGTETLAIARWFAPVVQLAFVLAVYFLARSLGQRVAVALVAAFIAHAANWVAQDYLSPQAIAFTLGIVVVALVLRSSTHVAAAWVAVPIFVAIVVTHQLTPYWLLAAIAGLTVLGRVRPRYLVFVLAAIAIGYMAMHMDVVSRFGSLLSFDFFSNIRTSAQRAGGDPSLGQIVSSVAARASAGIVWVAAASVIVWRLVRQRPQWRSTLTGATLAFSSVLILLGQSYGGEAVFRVYLYSLPGCAVIVAPIATAMLEGAVTRFAARARVGATLLVTALTILSAQAYYGGWFANLVTPESVTVATRILKEDDPTTLTIGVAPGAPGRLVAEYVDFVRAHEGFDTGIDTWLNSWWTKEDFSDPRRMNRMTDGLVADHQNAIILITRQMKYYNDYYGTLPPGSLENFVEIVRSDPRWVLEDSDADILLFRLDLDAAEEG